MRIGIISDTHDHITHIREFVRIFQELDLTPRLLPSVVGVPLVWLAVLALSVATSAVLVRIPVVNSWLV